MDRLTYYEGGKARLKIGDVECSGSWVDRLAAYEDTGLEPEQVQDMMTDWVVWKEAEAGDRLIVLPCKVGDTVYLASRATQEIDEMLVNAITVYEDGRISLRLGDFPHTRRFVHDIGLTVFLTREEAEAVLGGDGDAQS